MIVYKVYVQYEVEEDTTCWCIYTYRDEDEAKEVVEGLKAVQSEYPIDGIRCLYFYEAFDTSTRGCNPYAC